MTSFGGQHPRGTNNFANPSLAYVGSRSVGLQPISQNHTSGHGRDSIRWGETANLRKERTSSFHEGRRLPSQSQPHNCSAKTRVGVQTPPTFEHPCWSATIIVAQRNGLKRFVSNVPIARGKKDQKNPKCAVGYNPGALGGRVKFAWFESEANFGEPTWHLDKSIRGHHSR